MPLLPSRNDLDEDVFEAGCYGTWCFSRYLSLLQERAQRCGDTGISDEHMQLVAEDGNLVDTRRLLECRPCSSKRRTTKLEQLPAKVTSPQLAGSIDRD